jgi:hypothetical protein
MGGDAKRAARDLNETKPIPINTLSQHLSLFVINALYYSAPPKSLHRQTSFTNEPEDETEAFSQGG